MARIESRILGDQAEQAAEELEALLRDTLACQPSRVRAALPSPHADTRGLDPLALALVVSIPAAVLSVADLTQRLVLVPKLKTLIEWAGRRRASGVRVELVPGEGQVVSFLDEAEPGRLILGKD